MSSGNLVIEEDASYFSRTSCYVLRGVGRLPAGMVMGASIERGPGGFYAYSPSPNSADDQTWLSALVSNDECRFHNRQACEAIAVLLNPVDAFRDPADDSRGQLGHMFATCLVGHRGVDRPRRDGTTFRSKLTLDASQLRFDPSVDTDAKRRRKIAQLQATGIELVNADVVPASFPSTNTASPAPPAPWSATIRRPGQPDVIISPSEPENAGAVSAVRPQGGLAEWRALQAVVRRQMGIGLPQRERAMTGSRVLPDGQSNTGTASARFR